MAGIRLPIDRSRVLALHGQGLTIAQIAERLGCHRETVRSVIKGSPR